MLNFDTLKGYICRQWLWCPNCGNEKCVKKFACL